MPVGYEAGWAPEWAWMLWRRGKSLPSLEAESRFLSRPARSVVAQLNYPDSEESTVITKLYITSPNIFLKNHSKGT
jgi:hypothetical protein